MKTVSWAVIALLAGLVLGSWSMKADLRRAKKQITALKTELEKKGGRQTGLEGITSMLKLPPPIQPRPAAPEHRPADPVLASSSTTTPADASAAGPWAARRIRHVHTNSVRDQIQTAADLWRVRAELARNSFVSAVTTSDYQSTQFEVAMAAMNLRLSNSIRTWVDFVKASQTVTPETGVKIMNDLSATLVWAYNDLDRTMPSDWRTRAGSTFQVFDFIDPQAALPLVEVEEMFRRQDVSPVSDDQPEVAPPDLISVSVTTGTTN